MELLYRFEPLNLPGPMLEHMYKIVIERKGIHEMGYGYFLTKVFKYFNISLSVGKVCTVKQAFQKILWLNVSALKGKETPRAKWLNS